MDKGNGGGECTWDGESVAEVLVDVAVFHSEFGCGDDGGYDVGNDACLLECRADLDGARC
jgi:hypothetical protein